MTDAADGASSTDDISTYSMNFGLWLGQRSQWDHRAPAGSATSMSQHWLGELRQFLPVDFDYDETGAVIVSCGEGQ